MTTTISALDMPFDEAIAYLRNKTNMTSEHYTDVFQRANATGFTVAGAGTKALVEDFRREVARALETGTSLNEFLKSFDDIVARHGWAHTGTPGWRATIIYETNLSMAYSAGRYAQQTEPETLAAFPYWQYVHSGAQHPRLEHLAWDGLVLRADDPFWDSHYPPNGWRCGCRVAPVSERSLSRQGKSGPDPAPAIETREWSNPKTGEVHQVPKGIDPGFDYNPGKQWQNSQPDPSIKPVNFRSRHDADAQMAKATESWAADLARPELQAVSEYRGVSAFRINEQLRAGRIVPSDRPAIEALTGALDRSRLPHDVRVWRGEQLGTPNINAMIGDVIDFPGFTSTTFDAGMAAEQAEGHLTMEFRLPKNYKAAYINQVPRLSGEPEYELLLQRGGRFRVVDRYRNHLTMEPAYE